MNLINTFSCWLVRLAGGNNRFSRKHGANLKRCLRCGLVASVKQRGPRKPGAVI